MQWLSLSFKREYSEAKEICRGVVPIVADSALLGILLPVKIDMNIVLIVLSRDDSSHLP